MSQALILDSKLEDIHSLQSIAIQDSDNSDNDDQGSFLAVLFFMIFQAMNVRQQSVLSNAKVVSANADAQSKINKDINKVQYSRIPPGAGAQTINRIQTDNQKAAAERGLLQNQLITCRQRGQMAMTQTSTGVNLLQQDASENSGLLETLKRIFDVINNMTSSG